MMHKSRRNREKRERERERERELHDYESIPRIKVHDAQEQEELRGEREPPGAGSRPLIASSPCRPWAAAPCAASRQCPTGVCAGVHRGRRAARHGTARPARGSAAHQQARAGHARCLCVSPFWNRFFQSSSASWWLTFFRAVGSWPRVAAHISRCVLQCFARHSLLQ